MFYPVPVLIGTMATAAVLCIFVACLMVLASMHLLDASFVRQQRGNWLLHWGTLIFLVGLVLAFLIVCYIMITWFAPLA